MNLKEKGFTYIIISIVIMMFITGLFLVLKNLEYQQNKGLHFIENYKTEISFLLKEDVNISKIDSFNSSFISFGKSKSYNIKICSIYFDGNSSYILSNYLKEDFEFIEDQETKIFSKEYFDENISFGNCFYDLKSIEIIKYYIEVYNNKEKIVYNQ